jgi:hypothetical protein
MFIGAKIVVRRQASIDVSIVGMNDEGVMKTIRAGQQPGTMHQGSHLSPGLASLNSVSLLCLPMLPKRRGWPALLAAVIHGSRAQILIEMHSGPECI